MPVPEMETKVLQKSFSIQSIRFDLSLQVRNRFVSNRYVDPVVTEMDCPGQSDSSTTIHCRADYERERKMRDNIRNFLNCRRVDCGDKGRFWTWYKNRRIAIRKKGRTI